MTREEEIEKAAKEYSDNQFAMAESRTVAPYCNDGTFADAFIVGAEWVYKNQVRFQMVECEECGLKKWMPV